MTNENSISVELMNQINSELRQGNNWIAYNIISCSINDSGLCFFNNKDEANDLAESNISDHDNYRVLKAISIEDVIKQISYGELQFELNAQSSDVEQRFSKEPNLFTQKTNVMNEKNYDYLKDQIKFTGFGEGLENELKDKMQKQTPDFQIAHKAKFGSDELNAVLHFKKSDETDMYFFNRYQVSLKPEQSSETMEQTFYINKGNNITLKEAFNLMNGRAVNKDLTNKEGEVYNTWVQMDFKQTDNNGNYKMKHFHQNYGYDLDSALAKHPITELLNEKDKTRLVESLQKGNRQSVTIVQGNSEKKQFIEANPQFKTINMYDGNMQRINNRQGQNEKKGQSEQNSVKQNAKNENQKQGGDADDGDAMPKASNKRKKKQNHSVS